MTLERLVDKQARYKEDERSRPALEMPGRSRQAKAQAMADKWHNAVVKHVQHGKLRFGRVRFQGILNPNWFRIDWQNGSSSEHMGRIFANLERVNEADAPYNVPSPLDPVVVAATRSLANSSPATTSHPWRRATIDEMGLTNEDWTTLSRIFQPKVLQSVIAPYLINNEKHDYLREARFLEKLMVGDNPRDGRKAIQELHSKAFPNRANEPAIPGLRFLLSSSRADVVLVPSSPELLLATMPAAAEHAGAIVIAKLTPTMEHLLLTGKLDHIRWLYYHKECNHVLIHHVFDQDLVRFATWLYLFPRHRRKEFLKPDIPHACSYISSDLKTGNITAMHW